MSGETTSALVAESAVENPKMQNALAVVKLASEPSCVSPGTETTDKVQLFTDGPRGEDENDSHSEYYKLRDAVVPLVSKTNLHIAPKHTAKDKGKKALDEYHSTTEVLDIAEELKTSKFFQADSRDNIPMWWAHEWSESFIKNGVIVWMRSH
ncbi:hypothetical protein N0V86_004508 [Didymella sp. IMI 355093]|nr:hypothetical protein N0V86_004508 [Didymella sp. IMI 355093]